MGTKNPKTTFQKLFALLSEKDLFALQWPAAVKAAQTNEDLDMLESKTEGSQTLMDDLFAPRMRLVTSLEDAACLVKKYPAFAGKIFDWVQGQPLDEQSVEMLVLAYPDWREALYGKLLNVANTSLGKAVEALAAAEDTVDETREEWGYTAAMANQFHGFAVEELRKAEQILRQATELDDKVTETHERYEEAETAYRVSMDSVKSYRLQVARVARALQIEEGPFVRQLPQLRLEHVMEGSAYEDEQRAYYPPAPAEIPSEQPAEDAPDISIYLDEHPAEPASVEPAPGSDEHVAELLEVHRPKRVVKKNQKTILQRFQDWLDEK